MNLVLKMASQTSSLQRVMEGPLSKWTNVMHGWQYRWFVLDQASGLLSYYTVSWNALALDYYN